MQVHPSQENSRPLPRLLFAVVGPFQRFLATESASGIVLLVVAILAMGWANSRWSSTYLELLHLHVTVGFGSHLVSWPLHHWINDGLMTVFFLVAGMEVKRELVVGELRTLRQAVLPLVAAVGGMVVPAAIFSGINAGGAASAGWGIPMATDIAFALGGLTVLGRRVPPSLYVFLAALAIFDDLGAILVIALFYGAPTDVVALGVAVVLTVGLAGMARMGVQRITPYLGLGVLLWVALLFSGIHATLAGVILGLCVPARAPRIPTEVLADLDRGIDALRRTLDRAARSGGTPHASIDEGAIASIERYIESVQPPLDRLQHGLHATVAFGILPLFALANAGVALHPDAIRGASLHASLGVALGLILGKPVGVLGATWIAIRLGWAPIPTGARWAQLAGISVLAGIGFTMSIFIASLAFPGDVALQDAAKLGILGASSLCLVVGVVGLWRTGQPGSAAPEPASLPVFVDRLEFAEDYRVEPWVVQGPLVGQTLASADLRRAHGVQVVGVLRRDDDSRKLHAAGGDLRMDEGDTLLLVGEREAVEGFLRG